MIADEDATQSEEMFIVLHKINMRPLRSKIKIYTTTVRGAE